MTNAHEREFSRLGSKTVMSDAVKTKIKISVDVCREKDLVCAWSKCGKAFSAEISCDHMINQIMSEQAK